jgi:hypothetical protein
MAASQFSVDLCCAVLDDELTESAYAIIDAIISAHYVRLANLEAPAMRHPAPS